MRFTRFARGRTHKVTSENKTEGRYRDVLELRRMAGDVAWYRFEGFKLRLADGAFYTPDYAVMLSEGNLQCHEVKAGMIDKTTGLLKMLSEDTSRVKVKVAAEMYPFEFWYAIERPRKAGGGFDLVPVGAGVEER